MNIIKTLLMIVTLFLATCLFCWIFTTQWIFGPISTIAAFFGGILLISWLGVLIMHHEE